MTNAAVATTKMRSPPLVPGAELAVVAVEITTHVTKPKPLFTQPALCRRVQAPRNRATLDVSHGRATPLRARLGYRAAARREAHEEDGSRLPRWSRLPAGQDLSDFLAAPFRPRRLRLHRVDGSSARRGRAGKRARLDVAAPGGPASSPSWWPPRPSSCKSPSGRFSGPARSARTRAARDGFVSFRASAPIRRSRTSSPPATPTRKTPASVATRPRSKRVSSSSPRPARNVDCPCGRSTARTAATRGSANEHGWFLAGKKWELVAPPICPRCSAPMVHRERNDPKGEYFWACFADKVFLDSDRFGSIEKPRARGAV